MAFLKLMLIFLPVLAVANARSLDGETVQDLLTDTVGLTDDIACQDCKQIIEILKHLLSDQEFQVKLKNSLESLCDSLPDTFAATCRHTVDTNLPLALTFITALMSPDLVCTYLGLCNSELSLQREEMLRNHIQKMITTANLESSFPCGTCKYVLNTLPRAQTESALSSLLSEACSYFPFLVRFQCSRITKKYIKMIFEGLLNPGSSKSLCSLLGLCQSLPMPNPKGSPLSDCDTCLTLAVLARVSLGSNATQSHVSTFLGSVCQMHPEALGECESFTERHGQNLQGILGKDVVPLDVCQRVDLCMKSETAEQGGVGDPCTLGPNYTCRNMQTAYTCGVVSFCQKNVWN